MRRQTKAYLYTGIVVIFWSGVAAAFKLALRTLEPVQLLAWSALLSTTILWGYIIVKGKISLLRLTDKKSLIFALALGLLNPFIFYTALFKAYYFLPGQIAMSINFSWPMVLTLLAIPLLKQKINFITVTAFMVSLGGVIVIAFKGNLSAGLQINIMGLGYVFVSTFLWALFWLLNLKVEMDSVLKLTLNFTSGTFFIFVFLPLFSEFRVPLAGEMVYIVYIALFEMSLAFIFWLKALSLSKKASQVSIYIFLIPFFSLVFLNRVLNERILSSTIYGLVLIVTGILLQKFYGEKGNFS
jgi:drug/metabolite transporter (DMT)-like permease